MLRCIVSTGLTDENEQSGRICTIRNKTAYDPHVSCIISEQNIYLVVHSRPFSQSYRIVLSVFKSRILKCFLCGHYSTWGDGSKNPKL